MPKVVITDAKGLVQQTGTGVEIGGAVLSNQGLICGMLGLNPTWNLNFGGATLQAAGGGVAATTLDVLTPANTVLRQALALRQLAQQSSALTAAQASEIFGVTSNAGSADISLSTAVAATNIIPSTLKVQRVTGDLSASLTLNDSATDLESLGDQALILFTGNKIAASAVLTIGLHDNNEMDAESSEFFTTATSATNILEREAATTDAHQDIILTNSAAETTILAGSFIYLHAGNNTDVMSVKMCLLTSGGKIVITTAN
jgi:hypothetical protein